MAEITGYTAARMKQIEDETVVDGEVIEGDLILRRRDGSEINAGSAIGPAGPPGPAGDRRTDAEQSVAIWELEAKVLSQDNGLSNWHGEGFFPFNNRVASRTEDQYGESILGVYRHEDRDQGFVGLDNREPLSTYNGYSNVGGLVSSVGLFAVSPSKRWIAIASSNASYYLSVYRLTPDGLVDYNNYGRYQPLTQPAGVPLEIVWSKDEKAIFVGHSTTPFLEAWTWNPAESPTNTGNDVHTGTMVAGSGSFGGKWANPAVLPSSAVHSVDYHPTEALLACSCIQSPYIYVYNINTTAGAFGAKVADPASLVTVGSYSVHWHPNGDNILLGWNGLPGVSVYAFNKVTKAFGSRLDVSGMPATSPAVRTCRFNPQGDKIFAGSQNQSAGQDSRIMMWPFVNNTIGAKYAWAAGAAVPVGMHSDLPNMVVDTTFVAWANSVNPTVAAQRYDAGGWVNEANIVVNNGVNAFATTSRIKKWPFAQAAIAQFQGTSHYILLDKAGTPELTGQLVTTAKTLEAAASQVYILDDAVLDAGVTRQYDVSVDGGVTWVNNIPVGDSVNVTPGTELVIRLTMTRQSLGQSGYVYWFIAWAG